MSTMVPMYGFGGGSGGIGATLTVTAPAGCTVTVSKDGKTKTKTAGADGVAVFKGLATGTWTVTIMDGEQTAQKTVTVTADYSTAITFFSATIHVTYPAGSTCTATDGVTTLTAPDTSGTWDCVVPNAGEWTVTNVGWNFSESVEITESGQAAAVDVSKYYLYKRGNEYTERTGGFAYTGTYAKNKDNIYLGGSSKSGFISSGEMDVSKFSVMHVICKNTWNSSTSDWPSVGIKTESNNSGSWIAKVEIKSTNSSETEFTIDLSGASSGFVTAYAWNCTITIYELWLT